MSQMIYKPGGDTLVWGLKAHVKVIEADELEAHLDDGWLDHPSQLFDAAEPEPEPEPEPRKKQRKGKSAASDSAEEFV
ncbi:Uncharacterised protein [Serratia quinivorans]|uniref:hypothetical protein n=1 Tax=Serratia quinivorans TaxID=137545 RepID=UPI00217CA059|nr:hypothetical protein [Serratia quinivorans]CAI0815099.1 Uncharacterised protein [Serratia quinivorans]CAI0922760.1 Uncharacterised protein [Serratia quinivorans]CAI1711985.1 Uncharacterised protein [Serratia quinivorans]CAI2088937.1 Uncharacterised protein [Serratia quinivorans]CAI2430149.1 Uncharacterised protein [Serratia quinivorans]